MIAEIIPLVKLPRRFTFFDYQIPEHINLACGDCVIIPFHNREVLGVVRGMKQTSAQKLINIQRLYKKSWCSAGDITRFENIANALLQSPSNILSLIAPEKNRPEKHVSVQSKSLSPRVRKEDVAFVQSIINKLEKSAHLTVSADKEVGAILAHALTKTTKNQLLILVPRERDARELSQTFPTQTSLGVLHAKTQDKNTLFTDWRSGSIDVLISTKIGALLPAKKIDTILVLDAGSDDHINQKRNPRYDAREAVKLLAKMHDAKMVFVGTLPRLEEYIHGTAFDQPIQTPPNLVSLQNKLEYSGDPFLSETLLEETKIALQSGKNVLLFLNRKGVAKRLQCSACGHVPLCGTCGNIPTVQLKDLVCDRCLTEMWIPKTCPQCGQTKLALKGIGGKKVEESLNVRFPQAVVQRIEKGISLNPNANILLVTEYYFSALVPLFQHYEFGVVADLAADLHLLDGFRGAESAARKIWRLLFFADRAKAKCLLQTWLPDVITPILTRDAFVQEELRLRKEYDLPPYQNRVILLPGDHELPGTILERFTRHGEELERKGRSEEDSEQLLALNDNIKIVYDGPYVRHERTP